MPNGGRYWRFSYRFKGKNKPLALGVYPDVSLTKARERHQAAREQLAEKIDPRLVKQVSGKTFEDVLQVPSSTASAAVFRVRSNSFVESQGSLRSSFPQRSRIRSIGQCFQGSPAESKSGSSGSGFANGTTVASRHSLRLLQSLSD
jgi:hypothetical protein